VTGILREAALASRLGATGEADVAVLVLTFPDLVAALLIIGSVPAVLVPRFRERMAAAPAAAAALLRDATLLALVAGAAGAVAIWILAVPIVSALAPGFDAAKRDAAAPLIALSAAALPFAALAAVAGAYLQAQGRFAVPASGTVIFNIVVIAAIVAAVGPSSLGALAVGVVAASALRWLPQAVQAVALAGGASVARGVPLQGADPSRIVRAYLGAFGGTSVILGLPFVARALASLGMPGDVAVLNYATRIVDLPVAAVATVGSVAALPHLSELFRSGDRAEGTRALRLLFLATMVVTVPVAAVLALGSGPIAAVLYGRGAMDAATVARIAELAALGLVSLPAQGASGALLAAFVARRTLGFPLVASTVGLIAFAAAGAPLDAVAGVTGIMWAYVALHWALAVAFALRLRADGIDVLRSEGGGEIGLVLRRMMRAAR
jgi:murein biosynthesis integral membrane protein MurJ